MQFRKMAAAGGSVLIAIAIAGAAQPDKSPAKNETGIWVSNDTHKNGVKRPSVLRFYDTTDAGPLQHRLAIVHFNAEAVAAEDLEYRLERNKSGQLELVLIRYGMDLPALRCQLDGDSLEVLDAQEDVTKQSPLKGTWRRSSK